MKTLRIFTILCFLMSCGCGDGEEEQPVTEETIDEMVYTTCEHILGCESTMDIGTCQENLDYFVGCVTTDECFSIAYDYLECVHDYGECVDGTYVVGDECDELEELVEDCCD